MLEKLRAKPNHIKQGLSLFITIVIFSGIVLVWWSSRDARSRELEVREKTVSPVDGAGVMFEGLVSGLKEKMSALPSLENPAGDTASSTDNFDLSKVVVIDSSATTTKATSTSAGL